MTRNTKFYKVKTNGKDIYYRDLSIVEICALQGIKNVAIKNEMAADISITNVDPSEVPFEIKIQIGEDILYRGCSVLYDPEVLDITISEMREKVKSDQILAWITHINKYFPGTSYIDLLNLNPKDLIELVVLIEEAQKEKIFGSKQQRMNLVNPNDLPEDKAKALRDQIRNLNSQMGIRG